MARTIKWPFKKTASGGVALTAEDGQGRDALQQLIALAHLPGQSANPFDTDGGCPDTVFDAGGRLTGEAIQYSQKFFRRLETQGRARLESGYPKVVKKTDGQTVIDVQFEDLEANQPGSVEVG